MRSCDDWIESYVQLTSNTEPPEIFHRWVAISAVAACLQRRCVLVWGRLKFYPNLYIVLISPPGRARKSTAMGPVMDMLSMPSLGIKLAAEAVTREQLIRELRNSADTFTSKDGGMSIHCSLTIVNSELTVFLGYQNTQLISDLTDWYDCKNHWTYRTKNSGTDAIDGVWVNILGATTPPALREALPRVAIGGGLTSRIIFVYAAKKRMPIPAPFITTEERELETKLVCDLERLILMSGEFKPTREFVSQWADWYIYNDANPPIHDELFAGYCDRRPAMIMKLSTIMSASRSDDMILDGEDLQRAIVTLEEAEQLMPMALSGIGSGQHADVLARVMVEIGNKKKISMGDLVWKFKSDVTKWGMEQIINTLESMQFCIFVSNTKTIIYNDKYEELHPEGTNSHFVN